MAEEQNPVTHGELVQIVRRLDERISSMERNLEERMTNISERISLMERNFNDRFDAMGERMSSMERHFDERISTLDRNTNQNLTEMRADIRMLTRAMIGFYAFIIASLGAAFTLYKLFPNPVP